MSESHHLNVVPLRGGPSLQDIPAQLRALADRIEAGEYGDVDGLFAIMPREQSYPAILGWGVNDGAYDPIIQFDLARQWLVRCAVGLSVI
jgi:hypothetical protein